MKIEVSNGDLLDRYSILKIKSERITDKQKLSLIKLELDELASFSDTLIQKVPDLYENLIEVNRLLWDIEDRIRELEREQDFGEEFIQTARSVYRNNDLRASLKKRINQETGSKFSEEKSYESY